MQFLTPTFIHQFKCIADKCTYSCCKDWSIFFNEKERINFIKYGIKDIDDLSIKLEPDKYEMKNDSNGNCPYLEESGLCGMITTCGHDNVLCNTCQTFPRIISLKNGYIECTLSNACPAVIDILSNTQCPITFEVIDHDDTIDADNYYSPNLIACRNTMIDLMQISDFPIWMRLYVIYSFATKIKNCNISDTDRIIEQYNSVDYLLNMYKELLSININMPTKLQLMVNYLAVTHNHNSNNTLEMYYEKLYTDALKIDVDILSDSFTEFEKIYSQHSSLTENIAVNDIFRNIKCTSTEDMYYSTIILIIMMSLIKFTSFLEWLSSDKSDIHKLNKNNVVYFSRKFEHISFNQLKKQINGFQKEGWLELGKLFTLLR